MKLLLVILNLIISIYCASGISYDPLRLIVVTDNLCYKLSYGGGIFIILCLIEMFIIYPLTRE